MKLLALYSYLPSPTWGNRARSYYLLKSLARKYTISVLAMVNQAEVDAGAQTSALDGLVEQVQLLPRPTHRYKRLRQAMNLVLGKSDTCEYHTVPQLQATIDELLARDHYDAVVFDCSLTARPRLPQGVKNLIVQHNIEYELLLRTYEHEKAWLRKWYSWWEYHRVKPFELACCRRADAILVTSERERLLLKSLLPRNVIEVVANGVDLEIWQPPDLQQEVAGRIIFTGSMDYYPNIDAVLSFAHTCWPLIREQVPHAHWQIVGRNPPPEVQQLAELPGITVTGSVPDTQPYFTEAAVAIVPLQIGSGTRLKILEALAMQKAVVSTSLGAEGLSVVHDKHLLIADDQQSFAQSVVELLQNTERRRTLGNAGRRLVEAEYSWERCGEQLLGVLDRVL